MVTCLSQVAKRLVKEYPGVYDETNVCITGIHTHSTPGGFHQYVLLDVTSMGFVEQSTNALVEGIFQVSGCNSNPCLCPYLLPVVDK